TLAGELKRSAEEDRRLRDELAQAREQLTARGAVPERMAALTSRFERLEPDTSKLLRGQAELTLSLQTELADLEAMRTTGSEALRDIDAARSRRRLPGWFV